MVDHTQTRNRVRQNVDKYNINDMRSMNVKKAIFNLFAPFFPPCSVALECGGGDRSMSHKLTNTWSFYPIDISLESSACELSNGTYIFERRCLVVNMFWNLSVDIIPAQHNP